MDFIIYNFNKGLMITMFVFVMMTVADYLNVLTEGKLNKMIKGGVFRQYLTTAFLGATPGCLGAFMNVSFYVHGLITFGAMVGGMIATMDTYHGLIVPHLARPFGIFLMRQYMRSIPSDFIDAARIDGASEFGIFWRVVLPQCTPALATLAIFFFVADWNSFMWPLIVTSSLKMRTVTVGLSLLAGQYRTAYARQMAAATLGSLPAVIVFLAFQKYFTEGITLTGLKG